MLALDFSPPTCSTALLLDLKVPPHIVRDIVEMAAGLPPLDSSRDNRALRDSRWGPRPVPLMASNPDTHARQRAIADEIGKRARAALRKSQGKTQRAATCAGRHTEV